jgi:hypothetical protein
VLGRPYVARGPDVAQAWYIRYLASVSSSFSSPVIPFLQGHIFDDVTSMTSSHDHQTSHDEIANIGDAPGVQSGKDYYYFSK